MNMKHFVLGVLLALPGVAQAGSMEVVDLLPMSNETDGVVALATASAPTAVTVTSTTILQLDSTMGTAFSNGLSAAYKRAEVMVQNVGTVNIYVAYTASGWTTAAAGWKVGPGETWTFALGKGIHLYALAEAAGASGSVRVGGLAWK